MSTTVDTRVVQMKFDNERFRKNIQETIDSLKELDQSLKLEDASKGFESISKSASQVNLSPLEKSVDAVKVKFSALETVAITALVNITNKAVNAGEKLIKSLSVDNIDAGWRKFEETTSSVGTLISQGFDMKEVENQLARLNWYTDETSYNFTDMVNNIGKFTATGRGLEESVTAMEGIANWAALSGANATKASQAMYQLAQAMGKGALKYDDYKSIQNVSMDTKEFRQNAIEAALAVGTLQKTSNGLFRTLKGNEFSLSQFATYLSTDEWLNADVMMRVFNKYSSAVNDLYDAVNSADSEFETASEAIAGMGDQLDQFGLKAFRAAQEARTWTDVIDSVKDAVSSKWKDTFELIIGNYQEAKSLFTGLANLLYTVFAESGNRRNDILAQWKELGGRTALLDGLAAGFYAVKNAIDAVKQAWNDIFHPGMSDADIAAEKANKLLYFTEKFREFMYNLLLSEGQLQNITDAFKGIFSVLQFVRDVIFNILKAIFPALGSFKTLSAALLKVLGTIGRLLSAMTSYVREAKLFEKATKAISAVFKVLSVALGAVMVLIDKAVSGIKQLTASIVESQFIQNVLNGIATAFSLVAGAVVLAYQSVKDFVTILTNPALARSSNNGIIRFIYSIIDACSFVGNALIAVGASVVNFFRTLGGLSFSEKLTAIQNKAKEIKDKIINMIFGESEESGKSLLDVINKLKEAFVEFFNKIDWGAVVVAAFTISMIGLSGALANLFKSMTGLFGNVSGLFGTLKKIITRTYTKSMGILNIAEAFAVLAASLWLLAQADPAKLNNAVDKVLLISAALTGMFIVITGINAVLSKFNLKTSLTSEVGMTLIGLAAAMATIAGSLFALQKVTLTNQLINNLLIVLAATSMLGLIASIISRMSYTGTLDKPTSVVRLIAPIITIASLAGALAKITNSLNELEGLDSKKLLNAALALTPVLIAFGALAMGAGHIKISTAIGLLLTLKVVEMILPDLAAIFEELNGLNARSFLEKESTLRALTVFMVGMVSVIALLAVRGEEISKGSKGITAVITSTMLLIGFLAWMTGKQVKIDNGLLLQLTWISVLVGVLMTLSQFTEKSKMVKFSIGMVLLTGALALLFGIANMIKESKIQLSDFYPLYGLMILTAVIEGLSHFTGNAKILPMIIMFSGIYTLMTLVMAMSLMSNEQMIKVLEAIGMLTAVTIAVGALFTIASHLMETKTNMKTVAGIIASLAFVITTLSAIGKYFKEVRDVPWQSFIAPTVAALLLLGEIAFAATKLMSTKTNMKTVAGIIASLAFVITTLSAIGKYFKEVRDVPWQSFIAPTVAALLLLGEIAFAATKLMSTNANWTAIVASLFTIIPLGGVLVAIGWSLREVSSVGDWKSIGAAALSALSIIAAITIAAKVLGANPAGSGIGLLVLAGGLTAVGIALAVYNWVFEKFVKTLNDLSNAVATNPIGTALAQITDGISQLQSQSSTIYQSFYDIGAYMAQGLEAGMSKNSGVVKTASHNMVAVAYNEAKKTAKIASPSKLFAALGVYIGTGFINGIVSCFKALSTTSKGLVEIPEKEVAKGGEIIEGEVADTVTNSAAIAATGIAELGSNTAKGADAIADAVDATGDNIEASVEETIDNVAEETGGFFGWLEKNLKKFDAAISDSPILSGMKLFGASVGDLFTGWTGYKGFKATKDKAAKDLKNIDKENVKKAAKSATNFFADMFGLPTLEDGETYFDYFAKVIKEKASGLKDNVLGWIGASTGEDGTLQFGSLLEKIKEELGVAGDSEGLFDPDALGITEFANSGIPELASGLSSASAKAQETKSYFEQLTETVSNASNVFTEFNLDVTKSSQDMLNAMSSNIIGMSTWADNMVVLAKKGLNYNLLKELGDKGPSAYAEVAAYAKMTQSQIKEANAMYKALKKLPLSTSFEVNKAYQYAAEMALKGSSDALNDYMDVAEDGLEAISDGLQNVAEEAEKTTSVFEDLASSIKSAISPFQEFNTEKTKTPEEMLNALKTNIFGMAGWADNMARLAQRGLSEDLLKALGDKGPSAYAEVAAYADMTDEQIKEANSMYEMLMKLPASTAYEVTKSYQYAGEMAINGFSNALAEYSGLIDNGNEIGEVSIESIQEGMETILPSVHQLVKESGLEDADWYATSFKDNITDFLETLWPQTLEPRVEAVGNSLLANWREYGHLSADSYGDEFEEDIQLFLTNLWPNTIEPAMSDLKAKASSAGADLGNAVVKGFSSKVSLVADSAENLAKHGITGVTTTILKGTEDVAKATTNLAKGGIERPFKTELMINSPSRVMMKYGEYITEGLALGIADGSSNVEDSSRNMATLLTTVMDNAIAYLDQEQTMSPVLTPILDLSEIQNGASALDTMFGTRQVSVTAKQFDANQSAARNAEVQMNSSRLEEAIDRVADKVVRAITETDKPVEVNVALQGDTTRLFNAIRQENSKFIKVNGYNPLTQ